VTIMFGTNIAHFIKSRYESRDMKVEIQPSSLGRYASCGKLCKPWIINSHPASTVPLETAISPATHMRVYKPVAGYADS
jgi:hypothetical protein